MAVKTVPVKKKFIVKYTHNGVSGSRTVWAHTPSEAQKLFYREVPGGQITEIFKRVAVVTEIVTTKIISV